ncbi:cation:proton antiporter [Achromobacter marplatensis]|jgi:NhaP-type Na+/H+ or K+/H+ antiporter|uniref:cation:proton antiporter n=1 Tax=Achromobacter marplatensis TaxID=470868 RepID=UPI000277F340|nr:cation:proton antiporter [Achromobacter marplatensis]EJO31506.1 CPA1 family Na(+)/H(+) antiporter [Achromobacter marplatensis]
MNIEAVWFLLIGALFVLMAVSKRLIDALPMTGAMVYLVVGFLIGPTGLGLLNLDLYRDSHLLRLATEAALPVSLFAVGMHLRVACGHPLWRLPLRLAAPAMLLTIALMTAFGMGLLGLGLGAAVLLAAALAPTDPVLANELRPREAGDDEPLRFALSGEGGANDGAAFPFVVLGIALCNAGPAGLDQPWPLAAALIWGVVSAVGIGWLLGTLGERLIATLRIRYGNALGLDEFLALGLMALCYGATLLAHGYGFLAVFCAGVALRQQELRATGSGRTPRAVLQEVTPAESEESTQDPQLAHAHLAESMMATSVGLERFAELALMLVIGCVVSAHWRDMLGWTPLFVAAVLFFAVRPASVMLALAGSSMDRRQRWLASWLGIRGVGTFYYLLLAVEQAPQDVSRALAPLLLAAIVASVLVHGISASPLMGWYYSRLSARPRRGKASRPA